MKHPTNSTEFYPLVLDDGGRNMSKRPLQTNDCAVRSLAIISGTQYDEVYDILSKAGRKSSQGFELDNWLEDVGGDVILNGVFTRIPTAASLRSVPLTPSNFSRYFKPGRYLLSTCRHVWAYVDGVHRDMWRMKPDEPLFSAWRFTRLGKK